MARPEAAQEASSASRRAEHHESQTILLKPRFVALRDLVEPLHVHSVRELHDTAERSKTSRNEPRSFGRSG